MEDDRKGGRGIEDDRKRKGGRKDDRKGGNGREKEGKGGFYTKVHIRVRVQNSSTNR